MLISHFKRGKDKKKRKARGRLYKAGTAIGQSASKDLVAGAGGQGIGYGVGNLAKGYTKYVVGKVISGDGKAYDKDTIKAVKNQSALQHKIAQRQANDLNKGKQIVDKPAPGMLYDRTKGKYVALKTY